jgi:post-segregation antitoxin (ccd killing protein)
MVVDWAAVRRLQFPGADQHASYLNTAVSGLMSTAASKALAQATEQWLENAAAAVCVHVPAYLF